MQSIKETVTGDSRRSNIFLRFTGVRPGGSTISVAVASALRLRFTTDDAAYRSGFNITVQVMVYGENTWHFSHFYTYS